jgi:hypothetical protein
MGKAAQGQADELGNALRHHLFNDGKGPECAESCGYMSIVGGGALTFGIVAICLAATAGTDGVAGAVCAKPLETLIAGAAGTMSGGVYTAWLNNYCTKNVCTGK